MGEGSLNLHEEAWGEPHTNGQDYDYPEKCEGEGSCTVAQSQLKRDAQHILRRPGVVLNILKAHLIALLRCEDETEAAGDTSRSIRGDQDSYQGAMEAGVEGYGTFVMLQQLLRCGSFFCVCISRLLAVGCPSVVISTTLVPDIAKLLGVCYMLQVC